MVRFKLVVATTKSPAYAVSVSSLAAAFIAFIDWLVIVSRAIESFKGGCASIDWRLEGGTGNGVLDRPIHYPRLGNYWVVPTHG